MPKNSKPRFSDEKFTLFPFLDALSGVVGVLALVICSLSLLATDMPKLIFDIPADKTEKVPHYVECVEEAVVIHPHKSVVSMEEIKSDGGRWNEFLERIQQKSDEEYVVLLIRMNGLESYDVAMNSIQKTGIDVGREIVQMDGEIEVNLELTNE